MTTNRFQRTRDDHRRERAEDYLEMIAGLIEERGEARAVDLAERMGVTHVSVGKTVSRLQDEGYVTSLPYRSIFLTDEGSAIAEAAKARHSWSTTSSSPSASPTRRRRPTPRASSTTSARRRWRRCAGVREGVSKDSTLETPLFALFFFPSPSRLSRSWRSGGSVGRRRGTRRGAPAGRSSRRWR